MTGPNTTLFCKQKVMSAEWLSGPFDLTFGTEKKGGIIDYTSKARLELIHVLEGLKLSTSLMTTTKIPRGLVCKY